jgi:ribosomal protein S18 acetylase RimI-like enzyme
MITGSTPILASADVVATLKFYEEVIGFGPSWSWGEPPTFGGCSFGSASLMFIYQPEIAAKVAGHQHQITVENADETYAQHLERGAKIISEIEDKPWGIREYTVEDPSGYHLRISGPIANSKSPSRPFPAGVNLTRRLPTPDEYQTIAGAAFYRDGASPEYLRCSWNGVVADGPDGEAVGMVRIVNDAPAWFSIWDVAVMPDWQGQGIGLRMMNEALAMIREASPGAWVYLFTYHQAFYEKSGFGKETVTMRKV